jgi:hypothetical protein
MTKANKADDQMPTTFPDKWMKVLPPEFRDTADAASVEDLKKMIFTSEGYQYTIEKEKQNDEKLNAARELVKEMSGPYRDSLKIITAKIKYCLFLLEGKGVDLG